VDEHQYLGKFFTVTVKNASHPDEAYTILSLQAQKGVSVRRILSLKVMVGDETIIFDDADSILSPEGRSLPIFVKKGTTITIEVIADISVATRQ
jgi:hypothetical protein